MNSPQEPVDGCDCDACNTVRAAEHDPWEPHVEPRYGWAFVRDPNGESHGMVCLHTHPIGTEWAEIVEEPAQLVIPGTSETQETWKALYRTARAMNEAAKTEEEKP